jgi:hypothetical protein
VHDLSAMPLDGDVQLPSLDIMKPVSAVAGINIYDVLEPCYHGHNPYHAEERLSTAVVSRRGWPLLGGLRPGPVPGFVDLFGHQLGHTPPCLDSRGK